MVCCLSFKGQQSSCNNDSNDYKYNILEILPIYNCVTVCFIVPSEYCQEYLLCFMEVFHGCIYKLGFLSIESVLLCYRSKQVITVVTGVSLFSLLCGYG